MHMSLLRRLGLLTILLAAACSGGPRRPTLHTGSGAQIIIRAAAPDGVDESDLGKPYDAQFRPLAGASGKQLFVGKASVRVIKSPGFRHMTTYMQRSLELEANLRAWSGQLSANASMTSQTRFAFFRAQQQTEIRRLNDGRDMRALVGEEKFYLAEIIYGRAYGVVIYGKESTFSVGLAAKVLQYEGGFKAKSKELGLQTAIWGKGLEPRDEKAIYAADRKQVEAMYRPVSNSQVVPIAVVYKSIPGIKGPKNSEIKFREVVIKEGTYDVRVRSATVNFDASDNQPYVLVYRHSCPKVGLPDPKNLVFAARPPSANLTTPAWKESKRIKLHDAYRFCLQFMEHDNLTPDDFIDNCTTKRLKDWPFEARRGKLIFRLEKCGKRGYVKDVVLELTPDL